MKSISVFFVLICFKSVILEAETPDFHYKRNITFEIIESSKGKYFLSSSTVVELGLLSDRALIDNQIMSVTEPFYAPFSEIKAFVNNKKIDKDMMYSKFVETRDVFFSDYKTHFMNFGSELKKSDVLSYKITQNYRDINYFPLIYIPNANKLAEYSVVIIHPENVIPEFEFFFPRDSVQYSIQKKSETQTVLTFSNIEKFKSLSEFDFDDIHCVVQVNLKKQGSEITSTSPSEFVKWYRSLVKFFPEIKQPIPDELHNSIELEKSNLGKIKILHDYVRNNVRYIADMKNQHSFVPHHPDEVLKGLYGDCKDRAYLIQAMAHRYGLNVNLVLVCTKNPIPVSGVHIANYNHVICSYEENGHFYFFDPTSKYTEFGNLPDNDIFSHSFIMDTLNPKLINIPQPPQLTNVILTIEANEDSLKNSRALITIHNDYFSNVIRAKNELRDIDIENFLNRIIGNNFNKISIDDFKFISVTDNSAVLSAKADLSSFFIESKSKKYIPKIPFSMFGKTILDREADSGDIFIDKRESLEFELNLIHKNLLANNDFYDEKVFGTFKISSELKNIKPGLIQIKASMKLNEKQIPKNKKSEFINFAKLILKGKTQMYIINKGAE